MAGTCEFNKLAYIAEPRLLLKNFTKGIYIVNTEPNKKDAYVF
jgi:hypothetical protein